MHIHETKSNQARHLMSILMLVSVLLSTWDYVAPAAAINNINATIQSKQPVATSSAPVQQSQQQQPSAVPSAQVRLLARPAPYAIDSNNNADGSMKNIMFRLSFTNRTLNRGPEDNSGGRDEDPWSALISRNGTIIGTRANFSIKKLLDTLHNNSFTSELKFDEHDRGFVNITISSAGASNMSRNLLKANDNFGNSPIDELLLEELILDANSNWQQADSKVNGSLVVKDNHRYESKYPLRSKPAAMEAINLITVPPIRSALEVVAENYTVRKISEEANVFAIKLLDQLNIERLGNRNLIQAPFAIYQGLALLLSGAMGETAKEMDKALLGIQSSYENIKLTHDQDRTRLMASLSDVIRQLQSSATNHFRNRPSNESDQQVGYTTSQFSGGTTEQHLIVANNLLFSSSAYEISNEFKNTLNANYNNTALTKIEVGSTESIQVVNGWIRRATQGVIPLIMDKKSTFDEFNVMALLCTSWLSQEWKDTFYRISSPLRSSIRLKGQGRSLDSLPIFGRDDTLLEFFDDSKQSHFVEFIRSRPTKNIHHYHSVFNNMMLDIVAVPFQDSNHRLIAITPVSSSAGGGASSISNVTQQSPEGSAKGEPGVEPTDASLLSRLIALMTSNPRKSLRSLWNIIAPEIITKQTLQNIQLARQKNVTIDEQTIETNIIPMVELSIPIIRSEADSSVSAALNHIGIVNPFDPNQANFIGINGHPFNYYKLHLSNVISKTVFNLNERGINYDKTIKTLEALRIFPNRQQQRKRDSPKADSITVETGDDSIRLEFVDEVKLNKPFMYLICDIKTKLILYTGVVRNPTQEGP